MLPVKRSVATLWPPRRTLVAIRGHRRANRNPCSATGNCVASRKSLTEPGTAYGKVTCYFPVGYGHGTVSTDALAALPAGAATVSIDIESEGIEWDPNWRTTARVATYAKTPTGDSYRGGPALVE